MSPLSSGKFGHVNGGAYCASKFAVIGFTETTNNEGRPYGVKGVGSLSRSCGHQDAA